MACLQLQGIRRVFWCGLWASPSLPSPPHIEQGRLAGQGLRRGSNHPGISSAVRVPQLSICRVHVMTTIRIRHRGFNPCEDSSVAKFEFGSSEAHLCEGPSPRSRLAPPFEALLSCSLWKGRNASLADRNKHMFTFENLT